DVGDAAQEYDVALAELAFGAAVDLENAERNALAPEDDVHGAPDAVLNQQFRGAEPLLDFEMIRDHGFSGLQRISGRRSRIGTDRRDADHTLAPPDTGGYEKSVLLRQKFQYFGKLRSEPRRRRSGRFLKQLAKRRPLQREDAEVGEKLLLLDS